MFHDDIMDIGIYYIIPSGNLTYPWKMDHGTKNLTPVDGVDGGHLSFSKDAQSPQRSLVKTKRGSIFK